jgi:hypothetical protein
MVDKLLTVYMARDVTLPSLIRAERGFKHFTTGNVLGRIEAHHDHLKRVKINQDLADLQEQAAKNNGLALQAKLKGKKKATNCGRTNLNYTGSSTQVLSQGLQSYFKQCNPLACWVTSR